MLPSFPNILFKFLISPSSLCSVVVIPSTQKDGNGRSTSSSTFSSSVSIICSSLYLFFFILIIKLPQEVFLQKQKITLLLKKVYSKSFCISPLRKWFSRWAKVDTLSNQDIIKHNPQVYKNIDLNCYVSLVPTVSQQSSLQLILFLFSSSHGHQISLTQQLYQLSFFHTFYIYYVGLVTHVLEEVWLCLWRKKKNFSLPFCWIKSCKVFVGVSAFPPILLSHEQFTFLSPHFQQNFENLSLQLVQNLSSFSTWLLQAAHTSPTPSTIISVNVETHVCGEISILFWNIFSDFCF